MIERVGVTPSADNLIKKQERKHRRKESRIDAKERLLQRAIFTLGIRASSELAGPGVGDSTHSTRLEEQALPGDPALGSRGVLKRAVKICMKEGVRAKEVARSFLEQQEGFKPERELTPNGPTVTEDHITRLSAPIARIFNETMGHK